MQRQPLTNRRLVKIVGTVAVLLVLASCDRPRGADDTAVAPPAAEQPTAEQPPTEQPTTAARGVAPGDHEFSFRHDGRLRSYLVHVPSAPGPLPVVVALHGGGGTGAQFQRENQLDVVADREGFLAVYPEGSGVLRDRLHTWNSGDSCCGFALDRNIDDVDFLRQVLADVADRIEIDEGRVYMTGHSNGAMMAYRFAVEAPELVTAIAPVAGAIDVAIPDLEQPVALLHIHSIDDPRALYDGGEGPPFPGTQRTVNHEPVIPGIAEWASTNGCAQAAERSDIETGTGANEGQTVVSLVWSACDGDTVVEHLVLTGSGHGWPGVTVGPVWQSLLGPPTTIIDASEEIWAFVSQFER